MTEYYVRSGAGGSADGSSWADAYTSLSSAVSGKSAGDIFYVSEDHAESAGGAISITFPGTVANPNLVICADHTGSTPPIPADLRDTASISALATATVSLDGAAYIYGVDLIIGDSTDLSTFRVGQTAAGNIVMEGGSIALGGSSQFSQIRIGNTTPVAGYLELINTTVSFAHIDQNIAVIDGFFKWRDTLTAIQGATIPTNLITFTTSRPAVVEVIGVDLSASGSGKTLVNPTSPAAAIGAVVKLIDCKIDAAVTPLGSPGTLSTIDFEMIRCAGDGTNYRRHKQNYLGTLTEEATIVRSGGASDGTTPLSWEIVTTANASFPFPFVSPPIAIWNDTDGSPVTVTVEGIWGGGAVPDDDEIWIEVEYLGDNSSPKASFVDDKRATILTTPAGQSSSSESWGGSTTKFKLEATFTPQQIGIIIARVKVGKPSSTFYIDPKIVLS